MTRQLKPRRHAIASAAFVLAAGASAPAQALDEDVIRNVLTPVYFAQSLTAVCVGRDRTCGARSTTSGTRAFRG